MNNTEKYGRQFFPVKGAKHLWAEKAGIEHAPLWCSVDLRDGNQALAVPMSLAEKLEFFRALTAMGFKEIEVGFPAATETEYAFLRALIEKDLIPDDVTVQVLTQSREHIIRKTFEALAGCKNAIVHLYNSTSPAQREQVFKKSKREIIDIAVSGAKALLDAAKQTDTVCRFEYSPESFTGTEPEFAAEICNAVLDVWRPTQQTKAIINLPVTVELSSPNVYADQVEYMCAALNYRDSVTVSLHPHNDRGCAVAAAELGLLAGAERVEGTLFGNGERTGNADLVTLALNMYAQGVDPRLDLSDLPAVTALYERLTGMPVSDRHPYAGRLVFAAFSGSHQDAIAKGLAHRDEAADGKWSVPYLPIDPTDVGRVYESEVIRINAQSGKGGIGYLLEHNFGYVLPPLMREDVGYTIKGFSDEMHAQLSPEQVLNAFTESYVNISQPLSLSDCHFTRTAEAVRADLKLVENGVEKEISANGNGRLDAIANAVKQMPGIAFSDMTYVEHALTKGSSSRAITYVSITMPNGKKIWGAGIHNDIMTSSINALFSAINRSFSVSFSDFRK